MAEHDIIDGDPDVIVFNPTHKLILMTGIVPNRSATADKAFWESLRSISFRRKESNHVPTDRNT